LCAGEPLVTHLADTSLEARVGRLDLSEGGVFLHAHMAHAYRPLGVEARLEVIGRVVRRRPNAKGIVDVDRLTVPRRSPEFWRVLLLLLKLLEMYFRNS
jgi:hypothetical protein